MPPETTVSTGPGSRVVGMLRRWFPGTPRVSTPWLAAAIGLLGSAVLAYGNAGVSYDFDETASLIAARLSLSDLATMLGSVDAVHGSYYLLLHGWIALFGEGESATRSLSALALGVGAAGLVLLGSRIAGPGIGVVAATIFLALPGTVHQAMLARPFACAAAATIWAVLALHRALERGGRLAWLGYAAVTALSAYLFLYAVLMLSVHLVYVLFTVRGRGAGRGRATVRRWLVAAIGVVIVVAPLALAGYRQRDQISWIGELPDPGLRRFLVLPAFGGAAPTALAVIAAVIAAAVLLAAAFRVRGALRRWGLATPVLALAWSLIPLGILGIGTVLSAGLLVPRYLYFTVPGIALLLALGVGCLPRPWISAVVVAALILAGAGGYRAEREPVGRGPGQDLRGVATAIADQACPGDAFVLQDDGPFSARPRWALSAYPAAFRGLDDIARVRSLVLQGIFSDDTRSGAALAPAIADHQRVWVAALTPVTPQMAELSRVLAVAGFTAGRSRELEDTVVTEYVREPEVAACPDATR